MSNRISLKHLSSDICEEMEPPYNAPGLHDAKNRSWHSRIVSYRDLSHRRTHVVEYSAQHVDCQPGNALDTPTKLIAGSPAFSQPKHPILHWRIDRERTSGVVEYV